MYFCIPIKCGIVDPNVNGLLYCPGKAMVLSPYDVEVLRFGIVSSLDVVYMDGTESYLTPLTLRLTLPMGMHTEHTLVGMFSPFQPIGIDIKH